LVDGGSIFWMFETPYVVSYWLAGCRRSQAGIHGQDARATRTGTHGRDAHGTRFIKAVVGFVPFEQDAAAPVEGVLQSGKFTAEVLHAFHAFEGIFHGLQGADALAEFEKEVVAHGFEGVVAFVVLLDVGFFFGETMEPVDALLVEEPVLVAGAAPFGEILMGDGFAIEEFGHDFPGFGQTIHPRENGAAEFAIVEAAVEFFAGLGGEAGDFT